MGLRWCDPCRGEVVEQFGRPMVEGVRVEDRPARARRTSGRFITIDLQRPHLRAERLGIVGGAPAVLGLEAAGASGIEVVDRKRKTRGREVSRHRPAHVADADETQSRLAHR